MLINYITNIDQNETSGGWSGVNAAVYHQLSMHFEARYVGAINPEVQQSSRILSKLKRVLGQAGSYFFYSPRRLEAIAREVRERVKPDAQFDFFHGITPWIHYDSSRPYCFYADTCFSNYMNIYHVRSQFSDLEPICDAEARWIQKAKCAFFGTRWALEQAVADYGIPRHNLHVVGIGAYIPIPDADVYSGSQEFVFVSHDFKRKGGEICVEAFRMVREQFPQARLTIIGERPPEDVLSLPGVQFEGVLRKTVPEEFQKLQAIFRRAFALVHPTSLDISPVIVIEIGYFGCPSITSRSFGIPDMVVDGETGHLISPPLRAEDFADKMTALLSDSKNYQLMRKAVRSHMIQHFVWQGVVQRMKNQMLS